MYGVSKINIEPSLMMISVQDVEFKGNSLARYLQIFADTGVVVDMISQSAPHGTNIDFSFTASASDLTLVMKAISAANLDKFSEIIRRNRRALQIRKLSFQLHRLEQEIPDSIQNPLQIRAAVRHIVARHAIGRTKIKRGAKPQRIIHHQSGRSQYIGHNKRSCLSPALL